MALRELATLLGLGNERPPAVYDYASQGHSAGDTVAGAICERTCCCLGPDPSAISNSSSSSSGTGEEQINVTVTPSQAAVSPRLVGLVTANSSAAAAIIGEVAADVQAALANGSAGSADVAAYGTVVGELVASRAVTVSDKVGMVRSLADTVASLNLAASTAATSSTPSGGPVPFADQEIGAMIEQLRGVGTLLTDNFAALVDGVPENSSTRTGGVWVEFAGGGAVGATGTGGVNGPGSKLVDGLAISFGAAYVAAGSGVRFPREADNTTVLFEVPIGLFGGCGASGGYGVTFTRFANASVFGDSSETGSIPAAISVDVSFAGDGDGDDGCGRRRVQSGNFEFCSWHTVSNLPTDSNGSNVTCAYYNTTELRWRANGCRLAGVQTQGTAAGSTTRAQCCCNHTTTFAVIVGGGGAGAAGTASTYVSFIIVYVLNSLSALCVLVTAASIVWTPDLYEQLRSEWNPRARCAQAVPAGAQIAALLNVAAILIAVDRFVVPPL